MLKKIVLAILVTAHVVGTAGLANANSLGSLSRGVESRKGQFISERRPTLAPFAQVRFCVRNPADCQSASGSAVVDLTPSVRAALQRVNARINGSVRPVNDKAGVERGDLWQVATGSGDCEDFALAKRSLLIRNGIPSRALRIAVAHTSSGEGHAVLVVKTSQGDLVLDNRFDAIKPWHRADLRWIKIQSADNPRLWFSI